MANVIKLNLLTNVYKIDYQNVWEKIVHLPNYVEKYSGQKN